VAVAAFLAFVPVFGVSFSASSVSDPFAFDVPAVLGEAFSGDGFDLSDVGAAPLAAVEAAPLAAAFSPCFAAIISFEI